LACAGSRFDLLAEQERGWEESVAALDEELAGAHVCAAHDVVFAPRRASKADVDREGHELSPELVRARGCLRDSYTPLARDRARARKAAGVPFGLGERLDESLLNPTFGPVRQGRLIGPSERWEQRQNERARAQVEARLHG